MDVNGLAWIGNIYEKFEAMCLEMEDVMYEDTVKYVETQAQTVGATIKRFYSDVMQDLHPESSADPVKVAAADLSLNPYAHSKMKPKASAKKDARETEWKVIDECEVISGKTKTGAYKRPIASRKSNSKANFAQLLPGTTAPISQSSNNLSTFSQLKRSGKVASGRVDVVAPSARFECGSRNTNGNSSKSIVDTVVPMSHASANSPATATIRSDASTWQKQFESACTSVNSPPTATSRSASTKQKQADSSSTSVNSPATATYCLSSESSDSGTCMKTGVVSQTEGSIYAETDNGKFVREDIVTALQDRLDDCSIDAAKNDEVIGSEMEVIKPLNESLLEETCVLVEGDKLHYIPQGKGSRKSYKKKLREAFSSKTRLARKEYEQIAAKYIEEESDQMGAESASLDPTAVSSTKIFPANSSESEWELL